MGLGKKSARQSILSLTIRDKGALYAAYMPFVKNGGLFIPTNKGYKLGDEVFMLLTLMDETERIPVAGKVVWVTPKGAGGEMTRVEAATGLAISWRDIRMDNQRGLVADLQDPSSPNHPATESMVGLIDVVVTAIDAKGGGEGIAPPA